MTIDVEIFRQLALPTVAFATLLILQPFAIFTA